MSGHQCPVTSVRQTGHECPPNRTVVSALPGVSIILESEKQRGEKSTPQSFAPTVTPKPSDSTLLCDVPDMYISKILIDVTGIEAMVAYPSANWPANPKYSPLWKLMKSSWTWARFETAVRKAGVPKRVGPWYLEDISKSSPLTSGPAKEDLTARVTRLLTSCYHHREDPLYRAKMDRWTEADTQVLADEMKARKWKMKETS